MRSPRRSPANLREISKLPEQGGEPDAVTLRARREERLERVVSSDAWGQPVLSVW